MMIAERRYGRRWLIGMAALATVSTGLAAVVARPFAQGASSKVNAAGGVAIEGYDPVAYFTEGRPVPGRPEFAVERDGARWLFASEANRNAFAQEPERYLPQYGGFCAYAVANRQFAKIDPQAWTIEGGRLFLNYDLQIRDRWLRDVDGYISRADRNWPEMLAESP